MKIGSEDHGVCFSELRVCPRVESGQGAGVPFFYPQSGGVVSWIVRTLGDAHADARHVLMTRQVRQVGLQQNKYVYFYFRLLRKAC